MKNGSNEILEAKVAERNERAKKLYRYVNDTARRVGDMTTSSQSIMDLFSMHIEIQRQKLRDNCEKLLFLDPINYGKKSLELLWRKVYYDTVSAAKKLRETDNENDSYLFTHLVCGIGHFHHFISRIQSEMKVQHKELDYISVYNDDECPENKEAPNEDEILFGRSTLYSCLIYLGDLSRYQAEIFHTFDSSIAARYYLQAAHINMSSGMPYNQLANLYLDKNYNIDSVCYYIHCLNCTTPFEGALDNLKKIFEKNEQFFETISDSESLTRAEHIQSTIVNFLSLIDQWYFGKNDTNIPQRCNAIAQGLKVSMDFDKTEMPDPNKSYDEYIQGVEEENTNPSYLHPNLVHKVVQICLFTIPKMTETDETKAFACKAFTLALLSQLLQKLLKQLESIGFKNPASNYRARTTSFQETEPAVIIEDVVEHLEPDNNLPDIQPVTNGDTIEDESEKEDTIEEGVEKVTNGDLKINTKKALLKRRRRRRVASSGSSDESGAETENSDMETFESCSDEVESDTETYPTDEDSQSEDSGEGTDGDVDVENSNGELLPQTIEIAKKETTVNGNATTDINENKKVDTNNATKELNDTELKKFLLGDNLLSSIKLLQDWALAEKDLILSCGDSGDALFQCVVDLLNIFTHNFIDKISEENKDCEVLKYAKNIAKKVKLEYKTTPLPEDINLRGTNICKFDKDAAEWQFLDRHKLSVYEENVIRILNFIDFGNFIANIVPRIRFNRTMKIFYLKRIPGPKHTTKMNHKKSREWHNSKKPHVEPSEGGLLRRLGRLWLTSQVRELERSGRQPAAPALLALDSAVLHKHLRRVKLLLRARNFILLIPAIVLQELDNLKREESSARDAIRWLELQLKSGSRFLRAQRPGQSRPLPLLKCPRKAPPHVHNFMQILEFCNHFIGEEKQNLGGSGDSETSHAKSTPFLVLLMGNQPGTEEERYKEFSVTGAAKSVGISIEYIEDFYTKWRQTVLKSGKKR